MFLWIVSDMRSRYFPELIGEGTPRPAQKNRRNTERSRALGLESCARVAGRLVAWNSARSLPVRTLASAVGGEPAAVSKSVASETAPRAQRRLLMAGTCEHVTRRSAGEFGDGAHLPARVDTLAP